MDYGGDNTASGGEQVTALIITLVCTWLGSVLLTWALVRGGTQRPTPRLDQRYREHEGDDWPVPSARERILARGTWPPSEETLIDAARYYDEEQGLDG